jgi:hypothetical protein
LKKTSQIYKKKANETVHNKSCYFSHDEQHQIIQEIIENGYNKIEGR